MGHGHDHGTGRGSASQTRLGIVLALSAAYMVAEIAGGLLTNSLALLADAAHMFTDVASLGLALFATHLARRPAAGRRTYGFYRAEILAALVNGATLIGVAMYIFIEAYGRLSAPPEVQGGVMAAVAVGGLIVNLVGLRILSGGSKESLNERGAWLHVLTDALGSVGAIVGGLLVWGFGWYLADPIVSVAIALLVIYSSWSLLKETLEVLMEDAPGHIDVDEVRTALLSVQGVDSVHDLHIWTITSGMVAASVHMVGAEGETARRVLEDAKSLLHDRFRIDHATIQVDIIGDDACQGACEPPDEAGGHL